MLWLNDAWNAPAPHCIGFVGFCNYSAPSLHSQWQGVHHPERWLSDLQQTLHHHHHIDICEDE
jgi:hypothetical protein